MKKKSILLLLLIFNIYTQAQNPVLQWNFDNAKLNDNSDSTHGYQNYVSGISGKALVFDGYQTEVIHKKGKLIFSDKSLTISAWIAPQEYSWNLSAIINQENEFKTGFFFGINHIGKLVGSAAVDNEWKSCISNESIPLLKWSFVVMVLDEKKGISLYINNKKAGENTFSGKLTFAANTPLILGKTQTKMTPAFTERGTSKAINSWMRLDGLLDEVQIYDKALTENDINRIYTSVKINNIQPLHYRKMPSGTDAPRPFGAYYTKLGFSPGWDSLWRGSDLPDIIVRFTDSPVKLVFWRGTGYIPALVSENGIWITDQSVENFGTGECYEAMGDKQCRYSHVRIIENTPARCVIHWRYALAGIKHQIFHESDDQNGEWIDEYWTAYPDGVVVRKQVLWSDYAEKDRPSYQFQETIFFNQPGTKPQDNIELEAITFLDLEGNKASYSWEKGAPKSFDMPKFKPIELKNFKSKYKPFGIYYPERITFPFNFGWVEGYSTFPCWNHWPISQVASDGRNTVAPDKVSHSSLTQVNGDHQIVEICSDHSVRVRSLMGMTSEPIDSLLPLARSWNFPAEIKLVSSSYKYTGYDKYQRAYLFENLKNEKEQLEFEIKGTKQSPVVNIPIVIRKWNSTVSNIEINGKIAKNGIDYTLGYLSGLDSNDLVIWINIKSINPLNIIVL